MLICFDLPWYCRFFAIAIADWLSSKMSVGCDCSFPRSEFSSLIQIASCEALESAMYSASAVDRATHVCSRKCLSPTIHPEHPMGHFCWAYSKSMLVQVSHHYEFPNALKMKALKCKTLGAIPRILCQCACVEISHGLRCSSMRGAVSSRSNMG